MNFDNETTFISAFIKTSEISISTDKPLSDRDMSFEEEKLNVKTQYHFLNYINDDDEELVSEQTTAKKI